MPVSPGASPFRTQFRSSAMRPSGRGGGRALAYPDGVPLSVASGRVYTADRAGLDFSNDIEAVMRLRCTDWSTGAVQTLVGRYVIATNDRCFRFAATSVGNINLAASPDGLSGSLVTVPISPSVALPDNTTVWIRMRLDLTNGSNSVATLETASDSGSNVEPSSWTANGTGTGSIISGVYSGAAPLEVGAFSNGSFEKFAGRIYRCIIRSGFGGTVIGDFNSDLSSVSGYADAYGNTWVIS